MKKRLATPATADSLLLVCSQTKKIATCIMPVCVSLTATSTGDHGMLVSLGTLESSPARVTRTEHCSLSVITVTLTQPVAWKSRE